MSKFVDRDTASINERYICARLIEEKDIAEYVFEELEELKKNMPKLKGKKLQEAMARLDRAKKILAGSKRTIKALEGCTPEKSKKLLDDFVKERKSELMLELEQYEQIPAKKRTEEEQKDYKYTKWLSECSDEQQRELFVNGYAFKVARRAVLKKEKSILEAMKLQGSALSLLSSSYETDTVLKTASIEKLAQFSDEDVKELINQLKKDKTLQTAIKNNKKQIVLESLSYYAGITTLASFATFIISFIGNILLGCDVPALAFITGASFIASSLSLLANVVGGKLAERIFDEKAIGAYAWKSLEHINEKIEEFGL